MKSKLLRLNISRIVFMALVMPTAALVCVSSNQAVSAGVHQCRFDPSGYFYLRGDAPEQFKEFSHLALWNYPEESGKGPAAGLYTKGGSLYRFVSLTADWVPEENQFVFEFKTAEVAGVGYALSGKFLKPCVYLRDVTDTNLSVAQGRMVKLKGGKSVAEAAVEFSYSPRILGDKNTDLLLAARDGVLQGVGAALAKGADANAADFNGVRALEYAVRSGDEEVVRTLLKAGADVHQKGYREEGPLRDAAKSGNSRIVESLLAAGASPNTRDGAPTPLINAAGANSLPVVKTLLRAGADVNARDVNGFTALMAASYLRDVDVDLIKTLIAAGADVNARERDGTTALIYAAAAGNDPGCGVLINAKADVKARTVNNRTALAHAVLNARPEIVKALLGAGAEPEAEGFRGFTILREALTQSMPEGVKADIVRALVRAGADVNGKNKWGAPVLLEAVQYASPEVVDVLLAARADANAKDKDGRTALMEAASRGSFAPQDAAAKVRLLIDAGADVNARDGRGSTPLSIATSKNAGEVVSLLRAAGAKN